MKNTISTYCIATGNDLYHGGNCTSLTVSLHDAVTLEDTAKKVARTAVKTSFIGYGNASEKHNPTDRKWSLKGHNMFMGTDIDFEDLVSEAKVSLYELLKYGLISTPASRFSVPKKLVYGNVHRRIHASKQVKAKCITMEDETMKNKRARDSFKTVEDKELYTYIKNYILARLDKRCNVQNIMFTYWMYFASNKNYTQDKIAKFLGVKQRTVSQYCETIKKILFNKDMYNLLKELK